ncbi:hypothetical protein [Kitasatospora sp. CB01950]|uniref:hypothetical protein n=1 Tax=Kitasatospora sp. CB01950 TaxID=1703930 RepID=UPI00093D62C1|nr:hypothetical protein [Kitasatospora sp. CB01950]OKJ06795.1 hypothetical protein AMK19_23340 [Kitasatospora sp. CB01950]
MTEVTVRLRLLDPGCPAVLVETADRVAIAVDETDPFAALSALAALIQERFDTGAWERAAASSQ